VKLFTASTSWGLKDWLIINYGLIWKFEIETSISVHCYYYYTTPLGQEYSGHTVKSGDQLTDCNLIKSVIMFKIGENWGCEGGGVGNYIWQKSLALPDHLITL
jgi:hypothetical protein